MLESLKYEILIKQYKNTIYNYAFYMLKDSMDADDVSQEVFIKIWKSIDTFNLKAAKAWIMKVTHNLCIDYLRRRKANQGREIDIEKEFKNKSGEDNNLTDVEVGLRKKILKEKISDGIKHLPETLRSVFVLYELQGFKYSEISETLNLPLNSVKVYLMRARKKLQEELREWKDEQF